MLYLFLAFLALKFMILHIFYFFLNFFLFFIFYAWIGVRQNIVSKILKKMWEIMRILPQCRPVFFFFCWIKKWGLRCGLIDPMPCSGKWVIPRVSHRSYYGYLLNYSSLGAGTKTPIIKPCRVCVVCRHVFWDVKISPFLWEKSMAEHTAFIIVYIYGFVEQYQSNNYLLSYKTIGILNIGKKNSGIFYLVSILL